MNSDINSGFSRYKQHLGHRLYRSVLKEFGGGRSVFEKVEEKEKYLKIHFQQNWFQKILTFFFILRGLSYGNERKKLSSQRQCSRMPSHTEYYSCTYIEHSSHSTATEVGVS